MSDDYFAKKHRLKSERALRRSRWSVIAQALWPDFRDENRLPLDAPGELETSLESLNSISNDAGAVYLDLLRSCWWIDRGRVDVSELWSPNTALRYFGMIDKDVKGLFPGMDLKAALTREDL